MSQNSKIEWTDTTWNPVRGCSRVSEGCRRCYAEGIARRFSKPELAYEGLIAKGGQWNGEIKLVEHLIEEPLKWKSPRRVFVNSMSDLFHENLPFQQIARVFTVMESCPQHTFQVLTKRPERMKAFMDIWPVLPNVWLGVSVEDQATANERIPLLLQTRACVRFVSAEPLLDLITLEPCWCEPMTLCEECPSARDGTEIECSLTDASIDWVIAGGESGHGARSMHPAWARSLRDQCQSAGVPFFFKQWGEYKPLTPESDCSEMLRVGKKSAGRHLDGRIHNAFPGVSA